MPACKNCGAQLVAKTWRGGRTEHPSMLSRRKFCNRNCMAAWQTGQVKVPNAKNCRRQSGRTAAAACERCSRANCKLHVHHRDHDPMNNELVNLETLCVSCHRRSHSPNFDPTTGLPTTCEHCSKPSVKRGLCATHLSRFKRYGNALAKKRKVGSDWILTLDAG